MSIVGWGDTGDSIDAGRRHVDHPVYPGRFRHRPLKRCRIIARAVTGCSEVSDVSAGLKRGEGAGRRSGVWVARDVGGPHTNGVFSTSHEAAVGFGQIQLAVIADID